MVAATRKASWTNYRRLAHRLSSVVKDSLKAVPDLLEIQNWSAVIVTFFHPGTSASSKLKEIRKQLNFPGQEATLVSWGEVDLHEGEIVQAKVCRRHCPLSICGLFEGATRDIKTVCPNGQVSIWKDDSAGFTATKKHFGFRARRQNASS